MDMNTASSPSRPPPLPFGHTWPAELVRPVVTRHQLAYATAGLAVLAFLSLNGMMFLHMALLYDGCANAPYQRIPEIPLGLRVVVAASYSAGYVVGLFWVYFSYCNLYGLRAAQVRFSPAGAVGWHICPIANLWMIPRVFNDLWLGSDPLGRNRPSALIRWGMVLAFLASLVGYIRSKLVGDTPDDTTTILDVGMGLTIIHTFLSAAVVACLCYLLARITGFQAKKLRQQAA